MRMWIGVKPEQLCRKHLIGEHGEIHKMIGNLRHSGTWVISLVNSNFLEPQNALKRHDSLVAEMIKRGYNHNSPLVIDVELPEGKVNKIKSISDLKSRCKECLSS